MAESVKAYLKRIAAIGGSSTSEKKRAASRANAQKAREKRAANITKHNNKINKSK